jgi:ComF family protein
MPRARVWPEPLGALADLVFPPRCTGCGARGSWLCTACRRAIMAEREAAPRCAVCDRESAASPCGLCRREAQPLPVRIAGDYRGALRSAIQLFKFEGRPQLAHDLGALLVATWRASAPAAAEAIVTVPMPPERWRARGYNPAELLARACGRGLGLPVWPQAVTRTRPALPQHGLGAAERHANVQGLFACTASHAARFAGRAIIIVDDVTTTGATLAAVAEALHQVGAAQIVALALARPALAAPSQA